jgi:hypothetical protein
MKNVTLLATLVLMSIVGGLLGLNYFVQSRPASPKTATVLTAPTAPMVVSPAILTDSSLTAPVRAADIPAATKAIKDKLVDSKTVIEPKTVVKPVAVDQNQSKIAVTTLPLEDVPASKGTKKEAVTAPKLEPTFAPLRKGASYVIIGSFTDEKNARAVQKNISNIKTSLHKDGKYFRVSAGSFSTDAPAKQLIKELKSQDIESILLKL